MVMSPVPLPVWASTVTTARSPLSVQLLAFAPVSTSTPIFFSRRATTCDSSGSLPGRMPGSASTTVTLEPSLAYSVPISRPM